MCMPALQLWPSNNIMKLLLDPLSQLDPKTIKSHTNFTLDSIAFSKDFLFSIDRQ